MKKLLSILTLTLLAGTAYAEPQQTITNEQSYAIINLEKAPASENRQSIKNTKSWFCINIIVNGKIKDSANSKPDESGN